MLTLQFDGLFRCAPEELHLRDDAGFMCYGWVILRNGQVIARGHGGYASTRDAVYFSTSMEVMVCLVTPTALANSSWDSLCCFRSSAIFVFKNLPHFKSI